MSGESLPIITEIETLKDFSIVLNNNPGLVIIKLGATWCKPCKKIEPQIHHFMDNLPPCMQGVILDVDDNFELYAFFQKKKVTAGIPAILCYKKGQTDHIPCDSVLGTDANEINLFFERCYKLMGV